MRVGSCQVTVVPSPHAEGVEAGRHPLGLVAELAEGERPVGLVEEHHGSGDAAARRSTSSHNVAAWLISPMAPRLHTCPPSVGRSGWT